MATATHRSLHRLSHASWPRGFALVQFPNPPLILALAAGAVGRLTTDSTHRAAVAVSYVALSIWAYEEARSGVNWFRRGLGAVVLVYVAIAIARRLSS